MTWGGWVVIAIMLAMVAALGRICWVVVVRPLIDWPDTFSCEVNQITYNVISEKVRFCPECGHVGPVAPEHIDCCPDGIRARYIPRLEAVLRRDRFLRENQETSGGQE